MHNPSDRFGTPDDCAERPLHEITAVSLGHFAGRHELLLYCVELERRKADCGGDLQCVF